MATHAASLARRIGIASPDEMPHDLRWKSLVIREQQRRTITVTYAILNLQSVAFNVPPLVMNQEVGLCLPHPTAMWRASTEAEWLQVRQHSSHGERQFRAVLSDLLCGRQVENPSQISSFGNYFLIHGLVLQIYTERQAHSLKGSFSALTTEAVKSLVNSLQSWQRCWECSDESTLDPLSPKGPLAFSSTALLRIAYIRLNADLGPYRAVQIRDPLSLARSVSSATGNMLHRDGFTDVAVLQCIHALGILVQAGIPFVSRTHTQSWSIVHSLSHIECACFLSLWLRNMAMSVESQGPSSIREEERKLLGMITSVVGEWTQSDEADQERNGLQRIKQLIVSTARIWAGALGGEHVFQMVETIAQGLSLVATIFSEVVVPLEDMNSTKQVPSLSFLMQHHDPGLSATTRVVFDLGLRRDIDSYSAPIRRHVTTRQPISGFPDVVASLARGGLAPDDVDLVILSHRRASGLRGKARCIAFL